MNPIFMPFPSEIENYLYNLQVLPALAKFYFVRAYPLRIKTSEILTVIILQLIRKLNKLPLLNFRMKSQFNQAVFVDSTLKNLYLSAI